jgi:hypothetical protein
VHLPVTTLAVCTGQNVVLNDLNASITPGAGHPALGGTWSSTTMVAGSFKDVNDNDDATLALSRKYIPTNADQVNSIIKFTLTSDVPNGVCPASSANVSVVVNSFVTVTAPADYSVCAGDLIDIKATLSGGTTTVTWTENGAASIPLLEQTQLEATYVPTNGELQGGPTITFTITTADPDGTGPCAASSDDVLVTINRRASIQATANFAKCSDEQVTLSATLPTGSSAATYTWTGGANPGPGAFDTPNALTAIYTPTPDELSGITPITFTITADDPDGAGPCPIEQSQVTATIWRKTVVTVPADFVVCATEGQAITLNGTLSHPGPVLPVITWTENGASSIPPAEQNQLQATYLPTSGELLAGPSIAFTLTTADPEGPCGINSAQVQVQINRRATIQAVTSFAKCSDDQINLSATLPPGSSASTFTWTGGANPGPGAFDTPNALTAIYTPTADELSGITPVTFTITADDPDGAGPCPIEQSQVTATIWRKTVVTVPADFVVCATEGQPITVTGTLSHPGPTPPGVTWTENGASSIPLAEQTQFQATYLPTTGELQGGTTIAFTLTTADPEGPCGVNSAQVQVTINKRATIQAVASFAVCSDDQIHLSATLPPGSSASSFTWTGGANSAPGAFDTPNALTAIYTATDIEKSAITPVTFTITADDPDGAGPCPIEQSQVTATIWRKTVVGVPADFVVCATDGQAISLNGTLNHPGPVLPGITWTENGASSITSGEQNQLHATYFPTTGELLGGPLIAFTLTTDDPEGPCGVNSAQVQVQINRRATVQAVASFASCSDDLIHLSATLPAGSSAASFTWTGGANSAPDAFDTPNALTAIYTATDTEKSAITPITFTITADDPDGAGPCPIETSQVTVTVWRKTIVTVPADFVICATPGQAIALKGTLSHPGPVAPGVTWTENGFSSIPLTEQNLLDATYLPTSGELISGPVIAFTLTTTDPEGPCGINSAQVQVTLNSRATIQATADFARCSDQDVNLSATLPNGSTATSFTWTGGANTAPNAFDNPNALSAIYTATDTEKSAITPIVFTITTNDPDGAGPCPVESSQVTVTVWRKTVVTVPVDFAVCATEGQAITVKGTLSHPGAVPPGVTWTQTGGLSTIPPAEQNQLEASYLPTSSELLSGPTIAFTLTTADPEGPCLANSAQMHVTINRRATIQAVADFSRCAYDEIDLSATLPI